MIIVLRSSAAGGHAGAPPPLSVPSPPTGGHPDWNSPPADRERKGQRGITLEFVTAVQLFAGSIGPIDYCQLLTADSERGQVYLGH